ncbi:Porin subfamily protein [Rhizobiales bacterium GAS191]|nr:Porin subfamily protein [Rhizobiales bacterium GAS191]
MKPSTRIFLNSAAGMIGACGAQATDLPARKAAPAQYLQVCAVHGPGFFYIPRTDTCIRIGGRARFESVVLNAFNRATDPLSIHTHGRLAIDARTQTDWGLLRAYVRVSVSRNTGNGYFGSSAFQLAAYNFGFPTSGVTGFPSFAGVDTASKLNSGVFISAAVVQWGGFTAGRIQSFFDFYADNDTWFGITDSDILTQALAYTYVFGSGFSATLSIEDPRERQRYPIAGVALVEAGGINPVMATPPFTNAYPFAFSPFAAPFLTPGGILYTQRESVPDVVGVLRVDQAWGSAQLSAAYHRVSTSGSTVVNLGPATGGGFTANPLVPTVSGGYATVGGNAWAVQGGVKINLPTLAVGDYLYLEAAYTKGELSAVNSGPGVPFFGVGLGVGGTTFSSYDAVVGPTGHMTLTPAYSAIISFEHYWSPTLRSGFFGGAEHVNYNGSIRTAAGFAMGAACPTCLGTTMLALPGGPTPYNPFNPYYTGGIAYDIGTNLIWSPVTDLDIGVEVGYRRNKMQHKQYDTNSGVGKLIREDDTSVYRLRVSREF